MTGWPMMIRLVDGVILAEALADVDSVAPMVTTVPLEVVEKVAFPVPSADALEEPLRELV